MPLMTTLINTKQANEAKIAFIKQASKMTSQALGKSEDYVMCLIDDGQTLLFGGSESPAAYVEFKSIGLPEEDTGALAQSICALIEEQLNISADRVYIEFSNAQRHLWGWNNRTF